MARTCKAEQMNFERILARMFVLAGIVFTFWMGFGAQWAYEGQPLRVATAYGLFFSAGLIVIFVVGLFYEYIAALLLALSALAIVVWGIVAKWTPGAWGAMLFLIVLPLVASAVLYYAAANMQRVCDLQGVTD